MKSNNLYPLKHIKSTYRSLHHRNYRLFFGGQGLSLIGTWMQQVAVNWLTFRLTHSTLLLGVVGFASSIPAFLLAPFTGVLADRWNRHRTLIVTQVLSMMQALTLASLVLSGTVVVWHIILLSLSLGFINALDAPVRQSFVVELVEKKEDLGNAIALNSSIFNAAQLVGPAIAGILITLVGEGICFLLNGISFIAVIISLLAMKITFCQKKERQNKALWHGLKEGFSYSFSFAPIRSVLLILAWSNLLGTSYSTLLPVYASDILHGGAHTLGFLTAAVGCGAFIGSIFLASRKSALGLERIIALAAGLFGVTFVILSFARSLPISLLLMLLMGAGILMRNVGCNTTLQTLVDEDKRGRIMSLFIMGNMGMQPFGSLLAGTLADAMGAPQTMMTCGILCTLGAIIFAIKLPAFRRMVRPIYIKRGIVFEKRRSVRE